MRAFIVNEAEHEKRADRYLQSQMPDLPFPLLQKTFRKRDVKVNGVRVKESHLVSAGDRVEIYLPEELLASPQPALKLPVVYEDANLLVINKPQGLPVQDDSGPSVEKALQAVYSGTLSEGFPALCHRLDRNTGGLLLLAKNKAALDILFEKFKDREICKLYRCVVCGCPQKARAELKGYLAKQAEASQVRIFSRKVPGSMPIQTNYSVLETNGALSLLEVELVTGRTHQIRAHLAFAGFPVLGDGKYGQNVMNRRYGFKWQQLWSTDVRFCFTQDAACLSYLNGKRFSLPHRSLAQILADKAGL